MRLASYGIPVIPEYLKLHRIIFIKNLHIHQKHYDEGSRLFRMVKIKFLEIKKNSENRYQTLYQIHVGTPAEKG